MIILSQFFYPIEFPPREFYSHVKESHPEWLGVDLIKFKINDEEYDCTACGVVYKTRAFYKHVRRVHPDWRGVPLSKFKINNDGASEIRSLMDGAAVRPGISDGDGSVQAGSRGGVEVGQIPSS